METIIIHDKEFRLYIPSYKIETVLNDLASSLNSDLHKKEVIFLAVLNGAFMFASDLLKRISFNCRISFVKLASYEGTESSGRIKELIGINEVLRDKSVVILEDIIDTGSTLDELLAVVRTYQPDEIKIASLLFKPDAYEYPHKIDYTGIRIPNDFVVGYGLDYDGYGRNLKDIYTVVES